MSFPVNKQADIFVTPVFFIQGLNNLIQLKKLSCGMKT